MGGNLAVRGYDAQHLDLNTTKRSQIVPVLSKLLVAIDAAFNQQFGEPLWSASLLKSHRFLSGSSLHFFNTRGVPDAEFTKKKPTVGDLDTMVDKNKETQLRELFTAYTDKQIGPAILRGFQRGNEQFSSLWEIQNPATVIQIDFEFVEFVNDQPTDWARFSHSSAWEDMRLGIKGVFHKWLIQALPTITRRQFYLRKLVGRGKARAEQDVPMTDNMYSFAVASKEGGGLRAKYEPVIDATTGKPEYKDNLPVMKALPASGYEQDINKIFNTLFGKRVGAESADKFWSFTGLVDLLKSLSPEEKQAVLYGFLQKTVGDGAQGLYKNDPKKDISEKSVAINYILKTLGLPKPANFDQIVQDYLSGYRMVSPDERQADKGDSIVQGMAKNALKEASPSYKRKGIPHIYNPGNSMEMKDAEFIALCNEIMEMGGKLDGAPINLKVDGAGVRFGKDEQGKPFFMTSRVTEPKYAENYGDFVKYGQSTGQTNEQLARTKQYDEALKIIVNANFMKDIPADTIIQAEMLFVPMGQKEKDGIKFVNIPYDATKIGSVMTLVPFSIAQYSTGQARSDATKIKQALIKDSTSQLKIVNNRLPQDNIDVSSIVNPIAQKADVLLAAVQARGNNEKKTKVKEILTHARKQLSETIMNSPNLRGKDQLGNMIEGLVVNFPSGKMAKVTSQHMKDIMSAKTAANKKPTTGGNRHKPAVITVGSFAGHKGHQQLINQTIATANKIGGDPYIYVSPTTGPDDPIPPAMKVATLQKLYSKYASNIQVWNPAGNAVKKIEKELVLPINSPYNKIVLIVGSDRYDGFKNWMDSLEQRMKDPVAVDKYGGTQNQVDFETIRSERDADKGGTGISFTMLRDILKNPKASEQDKLNLWTKAFDTETLGIEWVKKLMTITNTNMQAFHLTESTNKMENIQNLIDKIKPLLGEASSQQKTKLVDLLESFNAKQKDENIPYDFHVINLTTDMQVIEYVKKALIPEMRRYGVPVRPENTFQSICSSVWNKINLLESQEDSLLNAFKQIDQRKNMNISVGSKVSILCLRQSMNFADVFGFRNPKTITKIYREPTDNKIVQLEFNNDPDDVWPRQPLASYNDELIMTSAFFPDAASVDHALTMLRLLGSAKTEMKFNVNESDNSEKISGIEQAFNDPATHDILSYARQHYPEEPDLQAAFVKFVLRSLKHSKEDDSRQDSDIETLEKKLSAIQKEIESFKGKQISVKKIDENIDYLSEK